MASRRLVDLTENDPTRPLVLRPAAGSRWGMTVIFPGTLLVVAGLMQTDPTISYRRVAGAVLLAVAVVLAVRCAGQMVLCADGVVTVRGVLFTRHVTAWAVTEVTRSLEWYPALYWQTATGGRRRAQLTGFWHGRRALPSIRRHNLDQLRRLENWITEQRSGRSPRLRR